MTWWFHGLTVPPKSRCESSGKAVMTEKGDNIVYSRFGRVEQPDGSTGKGLVQLFMPVSFVMGR